MTILVFAGEVRLQRERRRRGKEQPLLEDERGQVTGTDRGVARLARRAAAYCWSSAYAFCSSPEAMSMSLIWRTGKRSVPSGFLDQ